MWFVDLQLIDAIREARYPIKKYGERRNPVPRH
ncbi:hypothetical protein BH18ACT6_BH18ACT6_07130 [soil metagenome]